MTSPAVRLTASATRALPRWILLALCAAYIVCGLFGRDPWKQEDATGFGVMWTLSQGGWQDWLLPNLVGKPLPSSGPLAYWLGAASIRAFDTWLSPNDAARITTALLFCISAAFIWCSGYLLGRRKEVQPFKYAFGGEPSAKDYGRTLGDGALFIWLACFGLAERIHETTPELTQCACITMLLYGVIRRLDKPIQGTVWSALALGLLTLSGQPVLFFAALIAVLLFAFITYAKRREAAKDVFVSASTSAPFTYPATASAPHTQSLTLQIVIACGLLIALLFSWPLAAYFALPEEAPFYLQAWSLDPFRSFSGPLLADTRHSALTNLLYVLKNLPLFAWPAWPLALWSWCSWPHHRSAAHIAWPLALMSSLLAVILLQTHQTNRLFILLLPSLSILGAFALPTLKRGAINAMDWFALLSFTLLGSFVWMVWIAAQTGFPSPIAHNLARLLPGFSPEFRAIHLLFALLTTACWVRLVFWRLSCAPKVLWRSVILSCAGTTLMWVLLMTLWGPFINYSRTYRAVAHDIATHLPTQYRCITPVRLGNAQIASFAYFENMRFGFSETTPCDLLLRQDDNDYSTPQSPAPYRWKLLWEGRRSTDRSEHFRLYIRTVRSSTPQNTAAIKP